MVYVDLVGRTDRRWISHYEGIPANLANTGLNAMTTRGTLTIGMSTMPHMNIADRVGAFGWLFYDRHTGELIAFRQLSTFITGTPNDWNTPTRFTAGGISYSGNFATSQGAINLFHNGERTATVHGPAAPHIRATGGTGGYTADPATADNMNTDGRQVTMAVEISGATITRIHSILGWAADEAMVVSAADVRMLADDDELLGFEFPVNLDQVIDYRMFQLIGVNCLRDIRADHVVYVYADEADVITRVAVGTEVVEGVMTEASNTRFIVDGTSYNYAHRVLTTRTRFNSTFYGNVLEHTGSDVLVRLDAFGNAFEITVTGAEVGNFGIVQNATGDDPRGHGALLFTNDDATLFYNIVGGAGLAHFAPRAFIGGNTDRRGDRMNPQAFSATNTAEWHLEGAGRPAANMSARQLIGFGLNAAGNINVIERSQLGTIDVRSRTVARIGAAFDVTIDPNVVVFWEHPAGTWNVGGISDVDLAEFRPASSISGVTNAPTQYILNVAGNRLIAFTLPHSHTDAVSDDIFGVVNSWLNVGSDDQNLTGFFDGATTATTIRTHEDRGFGPAHLQQVRFWQFTTNAAGRVTGGTAIAQNLVETNANDRFVTEASKFPLATESAVSAGLQIIYRAAVDAANNFVEVQGGQRVVIAPDATIYRATISGGNVVYAPSNLNAVRGAAWVWGFNTEPRVDDITQEATVLIWMADADLPAGWRP